MKKEAKLLKEAVSLVALAAAVGFIFNAFSPDGIPLLRNNPEKVSVPDSELFGDPGLPATDPALSGDTPGSAAPETLRIISLDQLKRVIDQKKAMLIDARTPEEYDEGHIAGAVNFYAMEVGNYFDRIVEIPRDSLVVMYCSNPHCHFARTLAGFFLDFGFTNILLYDDGWDGWTDAGMPVATGEEGTP